MTEKWRDVPGRWPYEVSDRGRVRRATTVKGFAKGRPLKPMTDDNGRLYVDLRDTGARRRVLVHRLVAESFLDGPPGEVMGPGAVGQYEINHLDGDPTNNAAENLEWATREENVAHAVVNGLYPRGSRHGRSKLTEAQVRAIRVRGDRGESRRAMSREFGVAYQTILKILARASWRHVK